MKLLLDTHVALWCWREPRRIPQGLKDQIELAPERAAVSAATFWEIAIKQSIGKLKLPGPAGEWIPRAMAEFRFATLDIAGRHALAAGALPRIHGDPFDRMLIAQAREESVTLVTADPVFQRYDAPVLLI